jgi:hypothetical protein
MTGGTSAMVLLIRAWREGEGVRLRVLGVDDDRLRGGVAFGSVEEALRFVGDVIVQHVGLSNESEDQ